MDIAQKRAQSLIEKQSAVVLGIETSCDETAAAVVKDGRQVYGNAVYSQIPVHERYGGVVPELASRNHVEQLGPVVQRALHEAGMTLKDIDAIAVTACPGLVGALLTGVSYAKGLAYAGGLPLVGVNHIAGHIAANYISHADCAPPFICLVASGGHSHIFDVGAYTSATLIGCTRDDAAGEAFDKIARVLGLGYPGGPRLEALAAMGNPNALPLPAALRDSLDFSFSGVKTAVINYLHRMRSRGGNVNYADVAASFQHSVVRALVDKTMRAATMRGAALLTLTGGVSANKALKEAFSKRTEESGLRFFAPHPRYTGDNAAMIACAGYYALMAGQLAGLDLNAVARITYAR
ncbi:MAG: tRNA (adenosine(37)-N6)-threonylcarbamoyltransferase complex transferase subunit TsaD [Clostridiales bacterium]|nr:tRNA (adenosine(37)-N6)-threonylcarbamoyltransferase complex transferase subunit TsaD [Clostridiales bacterium]